jgi:zinc transport system ATP-binding protein
MNDLARKNTPAIHITGLSVYYGRTAALADVNLDVPAGEFLGIIGPNGGGKSTLIKAILGLVTPSRGSVEIFGQTAWQHKTQIGYVPQSTQVDRHFPISVNEVVLAGAIQPRPQPFFRYDQPQKDAMRQVLDQVGIGHLGKRLINELSGGEFQKTLIARALITRPQILLLDEPTASVDTVTRNQIYHLLADLHQTTTIVLVTHDMLAISSHVTQLACLNNQLVYHGAPALTEDVVNALYGCPVDLIAHGVPHRVLPTHEGEEP